MALVEMELIQNEFENLVWLLVSQSPIPAPTFTILGPTRLIAGVSWKDPRLASPPSHFIAPGGTLVLRAELAVTHVSIDELDANANAPGVVSNLTAWVLVTVSTAGLHVGLIRLEGQGLAPQAFWPALNIGDELFALPELKDVRGAALLHGSETVTIRYAVGGNDNLFGPVANRVEADSSNNWLIWVSGDYFADTVRSQLGAALTPPPKGAVIEDAPRAFWWPIDLPSGIWGVIGSAGIEKKDACGDVDVSVGISAALSLAPQVAPGGQSGTLDLTLTIAGDASDWDTFRCWLSTGGIGGLVTSIVAGAANGIAFGIITLVVIADMVRDGVRDEITDTDVGGGFRKVSEEDSSVTYMATKRLPAVPSGTINDATVGQDGLIIRGTVTFAGVPHQTTFEPNSGKLEGAWHGSYSCKDHRWDLSYEVLGVRVIDSAKRGPNTFKYLPVTIFPTSGFRRVGGPIRHQPGFWYYKAPSYPVGSPVVWPLRTAPPPPIEHMHFFLHTSAGIRRYDIGPAGPRPANPSDFEMAFHEVNCHVRTRNWTKREQLGWLVDGPPATYGVDPLRQWMVTMRQLPQVANVRIDAVGGHRHLRPFMRTFEGAESGVIEIVTDGQSELVIEHDMEESDAEVRITQRWLIPTLKMRLPGSVSRIRSIPLAGQSRQRMAEVIAGGRRFIVGAGGSIDSEECATAGDEGYPGRVLSVALPNGEVVTTWEDYLIVAVPWGMHRSSTRSGDREGTSAYEPSVGDYKQSD